MKPTQAGMSRLAGRSVAVPIEHWKITAASISDGGMEFCKFRWPDPGAVS
jgi:hypothetical protein